MQNSTQLGYDAQLAVETLTVEKDYVLVRFERDWDDIHAERIEVEVMELELEPNPGTDTPSAPQPERNKPMT